MREEEVILSVVMLIVFGGLGVLYLAMTNRRALREMEHRERLAMIQRGLIPSPEADPLAFEAATGGSYDGRRSERWRSAGITIVGFGLALMMLLSFTAGEPGVGIGVGGAFAVLGVHVVAQRHSARQDRVVPASECAAWASSQPHRFSSCGAAAARGTAATSSDGSLTHLLPHCGACYPLTLYR